MEGSPEARIAALEREVEELRTRLDQLERGAPTVPPVLGLTPSYVPQPRGPQPTREPTEPKEPREPVSIEDLLGGRVLAWVGGVAVLLGIVFLLAVAISRGSRRSGSSRRW